MSNTRGVAAIRLSPLFPMGGAVESDQDGTLVARVDERVKGLQRKVDDLQLELVKYVTRTEFAPVKLIAFGIAGLILSSVLVAVLATVIRR